MSEEPIEYLGWPGLKVIEEPKVRAMTDDLCARLRDGDPYSSGIELSMGREAATLIEQQQARIKKLEEALVRAAVPLKVLQICIQRGPYRELTDELQQTICEAVNIIRSTLSNSKGEGL